MRLGLALLVALCLTLAAYAADSTNPADYFFLQNTSSSSIDILGVTDGCSMTSNATWVHNGTYALYCPHTGAPTAYFNTSKFNPNGKEFCAQWWQYDSFIQANEYHGISASSGTTTGVQNVSFFPVANAAGFSNQYIIFDGGNWYGLSGIPAPYYGIWLQQTACYYNNGNVTYRNSSGYMGSSSGTKRPFDRLRPNYYGTAAAGRATSYSEIKIWNATLYGEVPPPAAAAPTPNNPVVQTLNVSANATTNQSPVNISVAVMVNDTMNTSFTLNWTLYRDGSLVANSSVNDTQYNVYHDLTSAIVTLSGNYTFNITAWNGYNVSPVKSASVYISLYNATTTTPSTTTEVDFPNWVWLALWILGLVSIVLVRKMPLLPVLGGMVGVVFGFVMWPSSSTLGLIILLVGLAELVIGVLNIGG